MGSLLKRQGRVIALGILAVFLSAVPAVADPSLSAKQAEAQRVLGQIRDLDSRLSKAVEAYNLANVKLGEIRRAQKVNAHDLVVAKGNLRQAQQALAARLVTLYTEASDDSTLEVLLGAKSLDELLTRIDTLNRVSDQDARVLGEVVSFRKAVERHRVELARAHREQSRLVRERQAHKASVEGQLAERQRLLSSIKGEIARIQAAERARQERLQRQLQARLAAQQQAQREEAQEEVLAVTEPDAAADVVVEEATDAPPARYGGVVGIAMQYLGVPYRWGGADPSGFDCSGFVLYVYAKLGVSLPHNAAAQFGHGTPVDRDDLQPGDLVFFDGLGHNGIYVGGGQFIHAPHTGDVVKISSIHQDWYSQRWVGGRRL